jgi:hypothetical protein
VASADKQSVDEQSVDEQSVDKQSVTDAGRSNLPAFLFRNQDMI